MKKSVIIIIILSVVLAIGATLLLQLNKKESQKELEALPRMKLFNIEDEDIANKFELNYSNTTIVVSKDSKDDWNIIEPVNMRADQMEAFANVKNFNTLIFDTIITNMADKEAFGIDNPKEKYSIWEGGNEHTVYVGNQTLDNLGYYVKYNDEVFKLEDIYIMALRKSVKDLRDKDFLKIDKSSVVFVDIDGKILLRRMLDDKITVNGRDDIELAKSDVAFILFSKLEAIDFVEENAKFRDYGFNENSRKITLELNDKSSISYYLSKVDVDVYAKIENDNTIYKVNQNIYNNNWYNISYYEEAITPEQIAELVGVLNPMMISPFENP